MTPTHKDGDEKSGGADDRVASSAKSELPMEASSISGLPLSKQDVDHSTGSPIVDRFSVLRGGPIYRFQVAVHMAMPDRSGVVKRALITTLLTWFPMLLLSLLQHRAYGSEVKIPFLYDIAAGIRFLIGLPLLVVAEAIIDPEAELRSATLRKIGTCFCRRPPGL